MHYVSVRIFGPSGTEYKMIGCNSTTCKERRGWLIHLLFTSPNILFFTFHYKINSITNLFNCIIYSWERPRPLFWPESHNSSQWTTTGWALLQCNEWGKVHSRGKRWLKPRPWAVGSLLPERDSFNWLLNSCEPVLSAFQKPIKKMKYVHINNCNKRDTRNVWMSAEPFLCSQAPMFLCTFWRHNGSTIKGLTFPTAVYMLSKGSMYWSGEPKTLVT